MTAGIDEAPVGTACAEKRGTRAGYQRHYNASECACDPCLEANTKYGIEYRTKRAKAQPEVPLPPPRVPEATLKADAVVPLAVLGALLSAAPTEVEEWAEAELGAGLVTKAISVAEAIGRCAA